MFRTSLLIAFLLIPNTVQATKIQTSELSIAKKILLPSKVLKEQREIFIYTPEDYHRDKKYQVIYLLDGEFHFIPTVGIVNSLVTNRLMPDSIVVGIKTSIRVRDYLPPIIDKPLSSQQKWIQQKFPRFGETKNFTDFLVTELFPYIEQNYSTSASKTLIGHSNGGVFALHTLLKQPKLFTNYLVISPAPWWGAEEIDSFFPQQTKDDLVSAHNLFLTIAGEGGRYYSNTMRIIANLESNAPPELSWQFEHLQNETHETTIFPSIYRGLSALYKDLYFDKMEVTAKYGQITDVIEYYANLSEIYQFEVPIPSSVLAELANLQLFNNREKQAFKTLNVFVDSYPASAYSHQNIAQAYMKTGQYTLAKSSFSQALAIANTKKDADYTVIDYLKDMIKQADSQL
jgi:predicted alpha/beta superfamily hydrolase